MSATAPLSEPAPADASRVVVVARGLAKSWGSTPVLSDVSFTIGRGVTGLLGSNGAGKTTTIGMILGLHRPDAGELEVFGLDPTTSGPAVRARLGYSPEHHDLPSEMRAHDLVRHIAEVHGLPKREATARSSDALWEVGLGEERFRPIGTMSTGQRQRVKLAQALVHDPGLMVLDEPTDGLDPIQREDMLALIRRIGRDFGIDILLSSHLLEEVERVCDDVVILGNGTVLASGSLASLTSDLEGMIVEVDDHTSELTAILTEAGAHVQVDGSRLVVTQGTFPVDLGHLVRDAVASTGAPLRRLQRRTVSLEDTFLELDQ